MQSAHKYLFKFDPLRGAAAIWVVVFHFQVLAIQFVCRHITLVITKGYLMV